MKGIKVHEKRTNVILKDIDAYPKPMLVLVKTVEQAIYLQNRYVQEGGQPLTFISGKDKASVRRDAVRALRDGTLDVLLATTIFDEGVDIPELATVILASGGKSTVKTIQRVGRCLRLAVGKLVAWIIDYQDSHHPMLRKHALARMKVYAEQEFEVFVEDKVQ